MACLSPKFLPAKLFLTKTMNSNSIAFNHIVVYFQINHQASHLEPHGVPSSGLLTHMPRALSDVKLEETPLQAGEESYGTNLGVPG